MADYEVQIATGAGPHVAIWFNEHGERRIIEHQPDDCPWCGGGGLYLNGDGEIQNCYCLVGWRYFLTA